MSALPSIVPPPPALAAAHRAGPQRPRRLREIGFRGDCPGECVLALLEEHAQQHPLNRALVMLDGRHSRAVTYVELSRRVRNLAARLASRHPDGGVPIAVLSDSSPAWGIAALAIIASRNVLVSLDTSMAAPTLAATLERVRPALIFNDIGHHDTLTDLPVACEVLCMDASRLEVPLPRAEAPHPPGDHHRVTPGTAVLAFTSGTTASPKAVEISFDNLLFQIRALTACFALRPSDRLLSLLPMHHMLEFTAGFLCPLWSGAQVNYLHSLLPHEALERMRALGITRSVTVPAWLAVLKRTFERDARGTGVGVVSRRALLDHARRSFGADFEHFVCGGAALADELADFFAAAGAPVVQGYGLTETCPVVATNTRIGNRRGSVGRPLSGTETGFSDAGEILVRGPHVATRYCLGVVTDEPVADDQGWFHTGDLGHLDEDGYLYVTGRIKTTIVLANGKNVQPEEIESRLHGVAGIADACVVPLGNSNSPTGERLCLVLVPDFLDTHENNPPADNKSGPASPRNMGVQKLLEGRVREALGEVAAFKRPGRILWRAEPLPRSAAGKVLRDELRAWAREVAGP